MKEGDYFANNPIGQWWPIKEKSGGQFVEQVIHTVDLVRYLAGEVVEVEAFAANGFNKKLSNIVPNYTNDDAMVVNMKFESGGVGCIMACCASPQGGGVFLNLWAGGHTAKFTDWDHHLELYRANESGKENIRGDGEITAPDTIFTLEDRAFITAVKTGNGSGIRSPYGDGVRTTLVTLAANESLEKGGPVRVQY
jgi:predicted dehydrogenase